MQAPTLEAISRSENPNPNPYPNPYPNSNPNPEPNPNQACSRPCSASALPRAPCCSWVACSSSGRSFCTRTRPRAAPSYLWRRSKEEFDTFGHFGAMIVLIYGFFAKGQGCSTASRHNPRHDTRDNSTCLKQLTVQVHTFTPFTVHRVHRGSGSSAIKVELPPALYAVILAASIGWRLTLRCTHSGQGSW